MNEEIYHRNEDGLKLSSHEQELISTWAQSAAPGEDKLSQLKVARPASPMSKVPRRRFRMVQQIAAGALLFILGYFMGHSGQSVSAPVREVSLPIPVAQAPKAPEPEPSASGSGTSSAPAVVAKVDASINGGAPVTPAPECKSPQVYKGKDGQFRIDTVLCQSGSRATWVINPGLELANASNSTPIEEIHQ